MTWWEALILGLVEGITEYLPVSSTGHLILASSLLGLERPEMKQAIDVFLIVVQGGAILAVLGLYWPRVMQIVRGLLGQDPAGRRLAINLVVAFLPSGILGVVAHHWIKQHLFSVWPVLGALFLGGVWMIWLGRTGGAAAPHEEGPAEAERSIDALSWQKALGIGLFQGVSMWPGSSRSMMTIVGGVTLGLTPREAAEFSFLLALPTLGGATVYELFKSLREASHAGGPSFIEQLGVVPVAIGLVAAFVSAALAVRWLVGFLNRHGLAPFGWYRVVLTVVLGALLLSGVVRL